MTGNLSASILARLLTLAKQRGADCGGRVLQRPNQTPSLPRGQMD